MPTTPAATLDAPAGALRQARPRPGWALAARLGAMFLGNVAVANIAGPSIRASLHASGGEPELIVSGYTLAYAAAFSHVEEPDAVFALVREFTGRDK